MSSEKKVIIIGPAHPLRGGLASFDERLARQFQQENFDTTIYTFSLQYPEFLFPGTTQYSTEPAPTDISIKVCINSINPINWLKIGFKIKRQKPAIIVVRYWLPLMGPCLGSILRIAKNKQTKIICIADNVVPHEKRFGDKIFTKYFLKSCNAFITMSEKVMQDLRLFTQKKAAQIVHPLYDNFGEPIEKSVAREHLHLPVKDKIILFFGFIRKYKGLDLLLEALKILTTKTSDIKNIKLLIAGEFYEDRKYYDDLIQSLNIQDSLILKTDFIADSDVKYFLSAADFVIQPYKNATQSGVTPLAYHFNKPMLVTNVGGLPSLVPDKKVGLIAEPNAKSIAEKIEELYLIGEENFLNYLKEEKKKYSWQKLTDTIKQLAEV